MAGLGEADADRRGPASKRAGTHSSQTSPPGRPSPFIAASVPLASVS
jgi:hypothetical protein